MPEGQCLCGLRSASHDEHVSPAIGSCVVGDVSCFLESSLEVQDGHLQLILMKMWANARKVQKILEECFYNRKGKAIEELKVEIIKRSCFVCVRMSALTLVWASNASLSA